MANGSAPFDAEGMKGGCPQDRGDRKKYCCGRAGNKVFGHKEQAKREREGLGSSDFLPPQGNFSFVARRGSVCMANGGAPFDAEGMKGGCPQDRGDFSAKNFFIRRDAWYNMACETRRARRRAARAPRRSGRKPVSACRHRSRACLPAGRCRHAVRRPGRKGRRRKRVSEKKIKRKDLIF